MSALHRLRVIASWRMPVGTGLQMERLYIEIAWLQPPARQRR